MLNTKNKYFLSSRLVFAVGGAEAGSFRHEEQPAPQKLDNPTKLDSTGDLVFDAKSKITQLTKRAQDQIKESKGVLNFHGIEDTTVQTAIKPGPEHVADQQNRINQITFMLEKLKDNPPANVADLAKQILFGLVEVKYNFADKDTSLLAGYERVIVYKGTPITIHFPANRSPEFEVNISLE